MNRRLLILFILFLPVMLDAQEADLEKPDDAFATWTDIVVRKDLGNWHVGGLVEYCTIDHGKGLTNNEFVFRPIVGYNPLTWLRFQFQVDFLYSFYSGFYMRYIPDMTFHWKASDFRFSFRNRAQFSHHVETGKVSAAIRNRFKVDYLIPDSPVGVHVAAEPYWLDRFIKTRYYTGLDFKINKQLSLTADYVRYQHYDVGKPHQDVVYMTLYVRL
jgi:hypothetical protein